MSWKVLRRGAAGRPIGRQGAWPGPAEIRVTRNVLRLNHRAAQLLQLSGTAGFLRFWTEEGSDRLGFDVVSEGHRDGYIFRLTPMGSYSLQASRLIRRLRAVPGVYPVTRSDGLAWATIPREAP